MTATPASSLDSWLAQPWPPTVMGVGGCDAHDRPFFKLASADATLRVPDECWQTLNEAIAQLVAHGCSESESVWVFETTTIWVARRSDGAWVGVLTPRGLPDSTIETIKARLHGFSDTVTSLKMAS